MYLEKIESIKMLVYNQGNKTRPQGKTTHPSSPMQQQPKHPSPRRRTKTEG